MHIFLFTLYYPLAEVNEIFLEEELRCAAEIDAIDITVIPFKQRKDELRTIPSQFTLDTTIARRVAHFSLRTICKILCRAVFWRFLVVDLIPDLFRHARLPKKLLARFLRALYISDYLIAQYRLHKSTTNFVCYSYWCDEAVSGFYLAQQREPRLAKSLKIARLHRWEVREPSYLFPFRSKALTVLDNILAVSHQGRDEFCQHYPALAQRISCFYLGVAEVAPARQQFTHTSECLEFVSCSILRPVKRVNLIYELLVAYAEQFPSRTFHWVHFGGGDALNTLRSQVKHAPHNLRVELRGATDNTIVRNYLRTANAAIFLNMSEHEGLPISIQEALSASIPVIATRAGGTPEAVDNTTGALLSLHPTLIEFAEAVQQIETDYLTYAHAARKRFEERFQSKENFRKFYTFVQTALDEKQQIS